MVGNIHIEQTLHGYADGHQLLASSVDLTYEQQAVLLVMSDLSGPAFREGYESYLTGYVLAGSGYYCIARTWFAPELPRPGCVWTQTFLIRVEDLARITDFEPLLRLFRRPPLDSAACRYEEQLILELDQPRGSRGEVDARAILQALYGSDKRVVIPSESAHRYESLVISLFEQQWPRLRRNFRFCTGALSLRETEFDLSVSPPEVSHSIGATGVLVGLRDRGLRTPEQWIETANGDLNASTVTPFREFIWRFGPDQADGRAAFRSLTELFCLIHASDTSGERLLTAIGHFFPNPNIARRAKADLFGRDGSMISHVGGETEILKLLVSHPAASVIPTDIINMQSRAIDLAVHDPASATTIAELALQIGGNAADTYLEGFFAQANWSPEFVLRMPLSLLVQASARRPSLVTEPALWARPDHIVLAGKLISQIAKSDGALDRIVSAMATAGAWDALVLLVEYRGAPVIAHLFDFVDSTTGTIDFPSTVFEALSERPQAWSALIDDNRLGPRSLALLSAEIDPRSWYARRVDLERWLPAAKIHAEFSTIERSTRSSAFFLNIGLSSWAPSAAALVTSGFAAIYEAAERDQLPNLIWAQLEPVLSWYSPSWDKCARLVRTVARAFKDRPWALDEFFSTFRTRQAFIGALGEIGDVWGGARFIRSLRDKAEAGQVECSKEQLAILKSA